MNTDDKKGDKKGKYILKNDDNSKKFKHFKLGKNKELKDEDGLNIVTESNKEDFKSKIKKFKQTKFFKVSSYILVFFIGYLIANPSNEEIMENPEVQSVMSKNTSYETQLSNSQNKISELEEEVDTLQEKVDEAQPWFEMKEEERKAEQERLEKEKAEKEAVEKAEKEKKEKQGYNTGITYSQLARTPDKYEDEKVKFSGTVLQVSEGLFSDKIRLGVNGSYDNVLYLSVPSGITDERILEDDYITIYGTSKGIETYTTVMGASVSIPSINVDKIDQ